MSDEIQSGSRGTRPGHRVSPPNMTLSWSHPVNFRSLLRLMLMWWPEVSCAVLKLLKINDITYIILVLNLQKRKQVHESRKMNEENPKMALSILTQITAGLVKTKLINRPKTSSQSATTI